MASLIGGIPGAQSRLSGGLSSVGPLAVSDVRPMNVVSNLPSIGTRAGKFRRSISGITKDATGAPLGSCVVKVFQSADDVKVDQQNSDAAGIYELSVYTNGFFYLVIYKAGAPDVAGTSRNDLVGV